MNLLLVHSSYIIKALLNCKNTVFLLTFKLMELDMFLRFLVDLEENLPNINSPLTLFTTYPMLNIIFDNVHENLEVETCVIEIEEYFKKLCQTQDKSFISLPAMKSRKEANKRKSKYTTWPCEYILHTETIIGNSQRAHSTPIASKTLPTSFSSLNSNNHISTNIRTFNMIEKVQNRDFFNDCSAERTFREINVTDCIESRV